MRPSSSRESLGSFVNILIILLSFMSNSAFSSFNTWAATSRILDRKARPASNTASPPMPAPRSEEHTSELQSRQYLECRLLLEKKKTTTTQIEEALTFPTT